MATLEKLKVSSNHWDTDKNPSGFFNYLGNNEAMIVPMKGGPELCAFLNAKVGRTAAKPSTVPPFIALDPQFDMPGMSQLSAVSTALSGTAPSTPTHSISSGSQGAGADSGSPDSELVDVGTGGSSPASQSAPNSTVAMAVQPAKRTKDDLGIAEMNYSELPAASCSLCS